MLDFLINMDHSLFSFINVKLAHSVLDVFFFWITDLHKALYFKLIAIPLVVFLFIKSNGRMGWVLFFGLILSLSMSDFIGAEVKSAFKRPRPEFVKDLMVIKKSDAGHYSFYSNHSSNMFTFAKYSSTFIPQIKIPLYLIASLVAYSRVYNGVHFPSDVIAGAIMGYFWGLIFSRLFKLIIMRLKNLKGPP